MTLEAIYFISQVIAAVALVVSIIFVGVQIRQNTRTTKAAAGFDAANSIASLNEQVWANYSDERMLESLETYDPAKNWDDFPAGIQVRMTLFNRTLLQKLEGAYFLHLYGGLDDDYWAKQRDWAASMIKLPFHATWWEQEKQDGLFSPVFIRAIEAARDTTSVKVYRDMELEKVAAAKASKEGQNQ